MLNGIVDGRGLPKTIKTDNGSEFISKLMDKWAYERAVVTLLGRVGFGSTRLTRLAVA